MTGLLVLAIDGVAEHSKLGGTRVYRLADEGAHRAQTGGRERRFQKTAIGGKRRRRPTRTPGEGGGS